MSSAAASRVVMLCLAYGVDKVLVYRESGSTPSMHACSGLLRDDFTEKLKAALIAFSAQYEEAWLEEIAANQRKA